MKKCNNCNDFALYDDTINICPRCNGLLSMYIRQPRSSQRNEYVPPSIDSSIRNGVTDRDTRNVFDTIDRDDARGGADSASVRRNAADNTTRRRPVAQNSEPSRRRADTPVFEQRSGNSYLYRGTISGINDQSRFHNRFRKIMNSLFLSEPYQFGHMSYFSVVRVEGFHEGRVSGEQRDLIFYGDVGGRLFEGDDVTVRAKRIGSRYIVTEMTSNQTDSVVRPTPHIPAAVIRIIALLILAMIIWFVIGMYNFVASGQFSRLMSNLISIAIVIAIIYFVIRGIFRRR